MKMTLVYKRQQNFIISSQSRIINSGWITSGPLLKISCSSNVELIGGIAFSCLEASQEGVPQPKDWGDLTRPLFELEGVKKWNQFAKGTSACSLRQEDMSIRVIPAPNRGKGSFVPLVDQAFVHSWPLSTQELGALIVKAIDISETM